MEGVDKNHVPAQKDSYLEESEFDGIVDYVNVAAMGVVESESVAVCF